MIKFVFSIFSFLFLSYSSLAGESNTKGSSALSGGGVLLCNVYNNMSNDQEFVSQTRIWVSGFLSGINFANVSLTKNPHISINLSGMTVEEKDSFIASYCKNHKEDRIYEAAEALYEELSNKEMNAK